MESARLPDCPSSGGALEWILGLSVLQLVLRWLAASRVHVRPMLLVEVELLVSAETESPWTLRTRRNRIVSRQVARVLRRDDKWMVWCTIGRAPEQDALSDYHCGAGNGGHGREKHGRRKLNL